MENKYTGEVPFTVGKYNGTLVYDYAALAIIRSQITQDELDNLAQLSPDKLAIMAAAGFQKLSPEITQEIIMSVSPPIMLMATAIDRALLFAYHGPEQARAILEPIDKAVEEAEKAEKTAATKKKTKSKKV